jgi:hypothetical protein
MNEISGQGITNYRFWDGVYQSHLKPKENISLAHKQIVEYAKVAEWGSVCICEDDVRFTAPGAWDYFMANVPNDFDLYLASVYVGELAKDNTVCSFSGLTLYVIHNRFYDKLLSANPNEHLDRTLAGQGKYVVCNPFIAEQYDGWSGNTMKEEKYGNLMKGRNLFGR